MGDWGLDKLHHHDPVSACCFLHLSRGLPDDHVGSWQAQELQERVQGLSQAQGHHPIPHLNHPWWSTLLLFVSVRPYYSWFCNSQTISHCLILQLINRYAVAPFEATRYI